MARLLTAVVVQKSLTRLAPGSDSRRRCTLGQVLLDQVCPSRLKQADGLDLSRPLAEQLVDVGVLHVLSLHDS